MLYNGCDLELKRERPFLTGSTFWFFIRTGHFFSLRNLFKGYLGISEDYTEALAIYCLSKDIPMV
jgi:hypothetical protein